MELWELLRYATEKKNEETIQQQIQRLEIVDHATFDFITRIVILWFILIGILIALDIFSQYYLNRKIDKRLKILEGKTT